MVAFSENTEEMPRRGKLFVIGSFRIRFPTLSVFIGSELITRYLLVPWCRYEEVAN